MLTKDEIISRLAESLAESTGSLTLETLAESTGLDKRLVMKFLPHVRPQWKINYDGVVTSGSTKQTRPKTQQVILNGETLEVTLPGPDDRF